MRYSGSRDGWMNANFKNMSDYKNPTVTLFKIKDGDCIGAFTKNSWKSSSAQSHIIDYDILFNL